jgi:phosphoribosylaminoimidazole-succinocarboxamide synthase
LPTAFIERASPNALLCYQCEMLPVELVDLKIEVGRLLDNKRIVIADVIDNDSWRIWPGGDPGRQLDKQCFRDDQPLVQVAENYAIVAGMTAEFNK